MWLAMVGVDIDYRNVEERLAEAESLVEELRSRIEALTDSEEYRQGRELDRLRKRTDEARRSTESRRSRADARMAATPRLRRLWAKVARSHSPHKWLARAMPSAEASLRHRKLEWPRKSHGPLLRVRPSPRMTTYAQVKPAYRM